MRKAILAAVLALIVATAMAPAVLEAAPCPTPTGFTGAGNMRVAFDWGAVHNENGVGVQPGGGMALAMSVDNPNGNAGMATAVGNTVATDCD